MTFQISLDHLKGELPDMMLEVGEKRYPVLRNDRRSLASARGANPLLQAIPDSELTHFVSGVVLPADAPQSYTVSYAIAGTELRCLALAGIHVPRKAVSQAQALKGASYGYLGFRRQQYGMTLRPSSTGGIRTLDCVQGAYSGDIADLAEFTDEYDAARYLVFHHSDILSLEMKVAATLFHHLDCAGGLDKLAVAIASAGEVQTVDGDQGLTAWARGTYTYDPDGNRTQQQDANGNKLVNAAGQPIYEWHYEFDETVLAELQSVVQSALARIHDDPDLEKIRFHIPEARTTRSDPLPDATPTLLQTGNAAYTWAPLREAWTVGQCVSNLRGDDNRRVTFDVANSYHRHLAVWCGFLDGAGKPMKLAEVGADKGTDIGGVLNLDTDWITYQGMIAPPPWLLFGIPVPPPNNVSRETYSVRIPNGASSLAVITGTIAGSVGDPRLKNEFRYANTPGVVMTLLSEIGIPVIALSYGALFTAGTWTTFMKQLLVPGLQLIGKVGASLAAVSQGGSAHITGIAIWLGNTALKLITSGVVANLTRGWAAAVAAGQSARFTPIMGTIIVAVQALDTAAQIGFTVGAIALGDMCTTTTITSTNRVDVAVVPADLLGFPRTGDSYEILVRTSGGETFRKTGPFDVLATPSQLNAVFEAIPSGGLLDVSARILVSAKPGTTQVAIAVGAVDAQIPNLVDPVSKVVQTTLKLKNLPIPITRDTKYSTSAKLEVQNEKHVWVKPVAADQPPAGGGLSCQGGSESLCAPTAITLSASIAQLGYSWNAAEKALPLCGTTTEGGTSLFTMQNLNLDASATGGAGAPDANIKRYGCGVLSPVFPLYPLFGRAPAAVGDPAYKMFVLEASTGKYVLRELDVGREAPTEADFRRGKILRTLTSKTVRAAAISAADGYVMVISGDTGADALEVINLALPPPATDTAALPAALRGGPGVLRGHLSDAVAICRAYDGDVFLVLENGNKRVQAFGVSGEPATDYFGSGTGKTAFLPLADGATYLDMQVEPSSGKVYILSRVGVTSRSEDFRLDIYDSKTRLLVTSTTGFAAAKFAIDTQQNAFALGWNVLTYKGRREPGLWIWSPSVQPSGGM